ncbi:NADH-quinone oxidoreductase subunit NuoK [Persicirhabdus sediminis]|uniref:NADH-quinone oxidoreductase subunit K n=1 Tax=Persicirhabdus sediminis TaxID=454144 RepID=A0A8J7MDS5_9BACT|nr:NADH-quinone oxidoreductase subunit NuoK [Persicirhabdus sediminis]MBK1789994.1 NADH-quinone oxidoreductase subunit NuoK [Persicirhabdus sediminis]
MPSLNEYLFISGLLFCIGLTGVIVRKNIIVIFMCLELMLAAASLTMVAFTRFNTVQGLPDYDGQMLVFFVITVAAAEVAVGLAVIVALYRARQTINTDELTSLKG